MNQDIRILLADDDEVIRENLPILLNNQEGLRVVAVASDGPEALTLMGLHRPDVILLDVDMPTLDGAETAAFILRSYPSANIVMLTAFERESMLGDAIRAGARGFLTKDLAPEELAVYIRKAAKGEQVMAPRPVDLLTANYRATVENRSTYRSFIDAVESLPSHLWPVYALIAQAQTNKEVTKALGLSDATVRTYATEIFTRTGVRNRAELILTSVKAQIDFKEYTIPTPE